MKCIICNGNISYYFSKNYNDSPFDIFMKSIGPVDYYKCEECGARFERPNRLITDGGVYDICPECRGDEVIKTVPCCQCSEQHEDTGDKYCDTCQTQAGEDIAKAIENLKQFWDSDLVDEALLKWVENH